MPMPIKPVHAARRLQQGIALFVALIFLVVLTLIGLAAFNNNNLQSRMAYAATETNFAFQSAETGLVAGEAWLVGQVDRPLPDCVVVSGSATNDNNCIWPRASLLANNATPPITSTQLSSETFWTTYGRKFGYTTPTSGTPAAITGQAIPNTNAAPAYVIEDLGADANNSLVQGQGPSYRVYYFQVTTRGFGANANAQTLVQSVYAKGY